MVFTGVVKAEEVHTEAPARTRFWVQPVRLHQINAEGIPRNSWFWLEDGGTKRLCLVDLGGRVYEHQLNALNGRCPTDVQIQAGQLFVRTGGRTFKYAPHGRLVSAVGIAPVTREWRGPFGGSSWVTLPEFVQTPVVTDDGQWVEVITHFVAEPPQVVPPKKASPTPVEEESIPMPTPITPPVLNPPTGKIEEEVDQPVRLKGTIEPLDEEKPSAPKKKVSRPRIA